MRSRSDSYQVSHCGRCLGNAYVTGRPVPPISQLHETPFRLLQAVLQAACGFVGCLRKQAERRRLRLASTPPSWAEPVKTTGLASPWMPPATPMLQVRLVRIFRPRQALFGSLTAVADTFATKLNATGTAFPEYSTYLGGSI